ncbi:WD40 repeat domain-containing protein [Streptomyces sp. NPDC002209]|uniref:WD40 repeat domain-containing protein n=1 Tax=Streptomyces sp. NPDC002209 TaxID=3364638 RepID=UPI00368D1A8E
MVVALLAAVAIGVGVSWWMGRAESPQSPSDSAAFTLNEVPSVTGAGRVTAVAAVDEKRFLMGTSQGKVINIEMRPGQSPASTVLTSVPAQVRDLTLSGDGRTVAVTDAAGLVRVQGLRGGAPNDFRIDLTEGPVTLNRSGTEFAYGQFTITLMDTRTRQARTLPAKPVPNGGRSAYDDWAITDDGRVLAAGAEGIDMWYLNEPEKASKPITCACPAASVALSPDGRYATYGTVDGHAVVVDIDKRAVLEDKTLSPRPDDFVGTVTAFGSGSYFAAGTSTPERVVIWDASEHRIVWDHLFPQHKIAEVSAVPGSEALLVQTNRYQDLGHEPFNTVRPWLVQPRE